MSWSRESSFSPDLKKIIVVKLNQKLYAYLMTMYQAEFWAQQFSFDLLTHKRNPTSACKQRNTLCFFLPKILSKKGNLHFIQSGTSAQLYDDILYFSWNSSVKGCCFCTDRNGYFLFFLSLLASQCNGRGAWYPSFPRRSCPRGW